MRPSRLIPRWFAVAVIGLLVLFTLFALGLGLFATGPMVPSAWTMTVAGVGGLVAAVPALAGRRRRREPVVSRDGTRVLRGPLMIVVGLLVAWAALYATAGIWIYVALTDIDEIESPGFALVTVIGALGMVPDLVRLLTGRLHRWTLEVGPESVRYRGFRTDVSYRRGEVKGGRLHPRGPAGVQLEVRGGGGAVIPATAFDVPAEQIIEMLRRR